MSLVHISKHDPCQMINHFPLELLFPREESQTREERENCEDQKSNAHPTETRTRFCGLNFQFPNFRQILFNILSKILSVPTFDINGETLFFRTPEICSYASVVTLDVVRDAMNDQGRGSIGAFKC